MQLLGLNFFLLAVEKLQYTKGNFIRGKGESDPTSGSKFLHISLLGDIFNRMNPLKK